MHVAMSHGAGDVAVMRELDWCTRHKCPHVLPSCLSSVTLYAICVYMLQHRYYTALGNHSPYWVVRQAAVRSMMGPDELIHGDGCCRRVVLHAAACGIVDACCSRHCQRVC